MLRYPKKQPTHSKIYVGSVKTWQETYKSTVNVLLKDILYKVDVDPDPDLDQYLQENRSWNVRKNAPCASLCCWNFIVDKSKGVDFKYDINF